MKPIWTPMRLLVLFILTVLILPVVGWASMWAGAQGRSWLAAPIMLVGYMVCVTPQLYWLLRDMKDDEL